jgi:hypothetical protein
MNVFPDLGSCTIGIATGAHTWSCAQLHQTVTYVYVESVVDVDIKT